MKKRIMTALLLLALCALSPCALAQKIDLGDTQMTDIRALMTYLQDHPEIDAVDMYATRLTAGQAQTLETAFPDIAFGWTLAIGDHSVRTDATAFSTLHSNKSAPHTSEDFAALRYCKSLVALDLGHNAITDISFLADLPNLRVLILGRNQIEDISVLATLTKLEYAELFSNRISDVSALAGLNHLIDLNLTNNPVADFAPVMGLSGLERLWCGMNSRLDRATQAALREALPGCEIDTQSHPTGGTWRSHARYDVIAEMFGTQTYLPF